MVENNTTYKYINLDYMEMMSEGDASMKMVMIEMLLEELPQEIEKMGALTTDENWSELMSVSHKMKSTLAFVGNDKMTEANKQIETLSKNAQQSTMIPELMTELKRITPEVIAELQQELSKLG